MYTHSYTAFAVDTRGVSSPRPKGRCLFLAGSYSRKEKNLYLC